MDFSGLINLVFGGLINGILSEKTAILSARFQKPAYTTDSHCSAFYDTDRKGGGDHQDTTALLGQQPIQIIQQTLTETSTC